MEQPAVNGFTGKNGGRTWLDRPVEAEERTRFSIPRRDLYDQAASEVNGGNGR